MKFSAVIPSGRLEGDEFMLSFTHFLISIFKSPSISCEINGNNIPDLSHLSWTVINSSVMICSCALLRARVCQYLEFLSLGIFPHLSFQIPTFPRVVSIPVSNWMIQLKHFLIYSHYQDK